MAQPIFYVGYYPGTRPIPKKRSGKRIEPTYFSTTWLDYANEFFDSERDLDIPAKVWKNVEIEFNNLFVIRYKPKDSQNIDLQTTELTEYVELPGVIGAGVDPWALLDDPEKTLKKWVNTVGQSALTYKELTTSGEVNHIWAPALFPEENRGHLSKLSMSSEFIRQKWLAEVPKIRLATGLRSSGYTATPKEIKIKAGKVPSYIANATVDPADNTKAHIVTIGELQDPLHPHVDGDLMKSFDNLAHSILQLVKYGDSDRASKMRDVQQNMVDAFYASLAYSPEAQIARENADPAVIAVLDGTGGSFGQGGLTGRVAHLKELSENLRAAKAQSKAWSEGTYSSFAPNPALDIKVMKAQEAFDTEAKKFQTDIATNKDNLANNLSTFADPSLVAWSNITSFRNGVFSYEEIFESIEEGGWDTLFKKYAWSHLMNSRLKYINPVKWVAPAIKTFNENYNPVYVGFNIGKFHVYGLKDYQYQILSRVDRVVTRLTDKNTKSSIGKFIVARNVVAQTVNKLIEGAAMALATSVGGPVAGKIVGEATKLVVAAMSFFGRKALRMAFLAISFRVDDFMEETSDLMTNFFKVCCSPLVAFAFLIFTITTAQKMPLRDLTTGEAGGLGRSSGSEPGTVIIPDDGSSGSYACGVTLTPELLTDHFGKTSLPIFAKVPTDSNWGGGMTIFRNLPDLDGCFGVCRDNNGDGIGDYFHVGIDINVEDQHQHNILIKSSYNGSAVVKRAGMYGSFGNLVILDAEGQGKYFLYYEHMDRIALNEEASGGYRRLNLGDPIGYVGTTGNSTGEHLHWEIHSGADDYSYSVNPCYLNTVSCPPTYPTSGYCPTTIDGS